MIEFRNVSEYRYKSGTYNLSLVKIANLVVKKLVKFVDSTDNLRKKYFACMTLANLSMSNRNKDLMETTGAIKKIKEFVVKHSVEYEKKVIH